MDGGPPAKPQDVEGLYKKTEKAIIENYIKSAISYGNIRKFTKFC